MIWFIVWAVVAVAFAVARGSGWMLSPGLPVLARNSLKAMAHVFVGALVGAWCLGRWDYGWLAITLSGVEVIAAVAKLNKPVLPQ